MNNQPAVKVLNPSVMRIKDLGERDSTQTQYKHCSDWLSFLHIIKADEIIKRSQHFVYGCNDASNSEY